MELKVEKINEMTRFSVVVPVYNGEKYLSDCLESVSSQVYKNFELIVVDDGSTDGSGVIANEFAFGDERIRVLHGENQGLLLARRRGLAHCRGEYVVFLDADDMLRDDALEKISRRIDATDADIVSYRYSRRSDFSSGESLTSLPAGFYEGEDYDQFLKEVCAGLSNNLWGKAFRRSMIDVNADYGLYARLMMGEDLLQLLPIVDSAKSLVWLDDVLYFYRPNETGSTACFKHYYVDDTERVARKLMGFGERWGTPEEALKGALRLYANLSKMLADSIHDLGREKACEELARVKDSLSGLSPHIERDIRGIRANQCLLLSSVLAGSLLGLRLSTGISHLGRKVLGCSI